MRRSDVFSRLAGNEELKGELCALLDSPRPPHALLITGAPGTGRNLAAALFAGAYLADENGLVERGIHPDCIEISGSGVSGMISVESVRDALYELNKSAVTADGRRVALIKDAALLNRHSANALLKMLEEPPDGVLFIMTADSEDRLLSTLLSRCIRLKMRPLSVGDCERQAAGLFQSERIPELCRVFGGRLGMVKRLLSSPERLALYDCAKRFALAAIKRDKLAALSELDCARDRESLRTVCSDASALLRDMLEQGRCEASRAEKISAALSDCSCDVDRNINLKLLCARTVSRL